MRVVNRKVCYDYELGERIEAGVALTGAEVKSVKAGAVEMEGAHVRMRDGQAYVVGLHIYPYKYADNQNYDPKRTRKLLLKKREREGLEVKMRQLRRLLVPTAVYSFCGRVKIELALARGKRKYEKREIIKKREAKLAAERGEI